MERGTEGSLTMAVSGWRCKMSHVHAAKVLSSFPALLLFAYWNPAAEKYGNTD